MASSSSQGSQSSSGGQAQAYLFRSTLNPLALRLDRTYYNLWRSQVLPAVSAHNLEGFLLGTSCPPIQFFEIPNPERDALPIRTINPDFVLWNRQDQFLVSWLLFFMTKPMLAYVSRCNRAAEIWYTLEILHNTQSKV